MTLPCNDHEARLLLWSSGELDADSAAASRAHAEECPSCGELLEGLGGLEAWASTSLPEFSTAFPPPRHVHAYVTHRFEEGSRRRPAAGWLASLLVPALALAMVWVSPAPGPAPQT